MMFSIFELRVMGYVTINAKESGWYKGGAKPIAEAFHKPIAEVKAVLNSLALSGYMEFTEEELSGMRIGVRCTEKGHRERLKMFKHLFPDIDRLYLRLSVRLP